MTREAGEKEIHKCCKCGKKLSSFEIKESETDVLKYCSNCLDGYQGFNG